MTETQAKSGNKGTSATPVDEEAAKSGSTAAGRAAVGRATVPADAPAPKFTRAPGMAPPPEKPGDDTPASERSETSDVEAPTSAAMPVVTSSKSSNATQPIKVGAAASSSGTGTQPKVGGAGKPSPSPDGTRATGTGGPASGGGLPPGVANSAAVGAARVGDAVRAARTSVSSAASRGPRRARLNLKRIDPWSVMKFAFAVSIVLFIVVVVATSVLYLALDAMGVFKSVNESLTDLVNASGNSGGFQITAKGVILSSALIGLVNVVLFTALATLGAFVYNVCADLVGGIELTLAERD
ncbi:DUF3566 domain-containing protein [Micromonospora sp. KC721]|uniref:DUF3566 domain-containing protein n=1 Tax=Micromonospora sp. KC721 TaxID=2530380 RepID=UPI001051165D|nr:DUF3566 domain-containing protein [Micromonospora sp. KC721]TDB79559.1 DUF3566 domain-containing protein [Micromonospora sp. KC721]